MTPEHCAAIMEHLPVIKACAEGKEVYFAAFDWRGKFIRWHSTRKINLGSLCAGFYSVKPRYQCIKPNTLKPIPYPAQKPRFTKFHPDRV